MENLKLFNEFINEGYSNYSNITNQVRDKIDANWDRIVNKKGKTTFSFSFEYKSKGKMRVIVKFDPKSDDSYQRNIDNGYEIVISTDEINRLNILKDQIIGTLVHELTHISQRLNNFHTIDFQKFRKIFKKEREGRKIDYKEWSKFMDDRHHEQETEKEATMMKLFELLRRENVDSSVNFSISDYEYFTLYPYKKILNKLYLYGVKPDIFNLFRKKLKDMLIEYTNKWIEKNFGDSSKWLLVVKTNILSKQFNLDLKDEIKKLYDSLKFDDETLVNYDQIKKDYDNNTIKIEFNDYLKRKLNLH